MPTLEKFRAENQERKEEARGGRGEAQWAVQGDAGNDSA